MAVNREMSSELTDTGRETDVIGLGCSREAFTEHGEVLDLITKLYQFNYEVPATRVRNWQRFSFVLDQYQEQPHLIDPHLERILDSIIQLTRRDGIDEEARHEAFRYFYFVAKVRGYKFIVRRLPHEISDLEPLLKCLEEQNTADAAHWETHYSLLLWFSMVMKIPFTLKRFDSDATVSVTDRILNVCKKFLTVTTTAQDMAAYLTALYITRPDIKDAYLPEFFTWAKEMLTTESVHLKKGIMYTLAGIFKHGQRDYLMTSASSLLHQILDVNFSPYELAIVKKPLMKLIQRIGLVFLKPRVAPWRYQRGSRSLASNLKGVDPVIQSTPPPAVDGTGVVPTDDNDDDIDVPEEIELVLEEVLQGLRDKNRAVQYSAAKGIGRITNRLSKSFADQVVESMLEVFSSYKESDLAWHGGCLTLAELARRGLLLPQRLPQVIPLVEQAMLYDELRGNYSVGSAVRDAACYLCWAFARAYDPALLQPYVAQLAKALIIMTVFDREEHVGRQGTFPHGIDILTTCDYFAVGLRKNAYLNLSLSVAQYDEYRSALIDHLVQHKIMHWDPTIRELTSQTLHKLALLDPVYTRDVMVRTILANCTHTDLHLRHGSILATGEILNAVCCVAQREAVPLTQYLDEEAMASIVTLCLEIINEKFLRSFGGDQMRAAVSKFIENCSTGAFPLPQSVIEPWLAVLRQCLTSVDLTIQGAAVKAVTSLIAQYCTLLDATPQTVILDQFISDMVSNSQQARMGNALALGNMPRFILTGRLPHTVDQLCRAAETTPTTKQWAEARKNALGALAQICQTMGVSDSGGVDEAMLNQIMQSLMKGVEDYTVDSRGDIGAIVRESAMCSLQVVLLEASKSHAEYLRPELITTIFNALVKQATEQIRRTRLLAVNVISTLLYCDPAVPHVPEADQLRSIIPPAPLDLSTEKECFDLWIRVMHLRPYQKPVITGLVSSIGSLTESLVKSASGPFLAHLRTLTSQDRLIELRSIADDVLDVFRHHLGDTRFMPYMFSFLDHISSSGCLDPVFRSISSDLLALIRAEMTSGSKPLKLVLDSIDLYCHLLRGDEATFDRCVVHLLSLLVSRFPRVRKMTATQLYETLLTLTDVADRLAAHQDDILCLLSDTDWDEDVEKLKPVRDQLKRLFQPPTD